jgi:hypothetical protein
MHSLNFGGRPETRTRKNLRSKRSSCTRFAYVSRPESLLEPPAEIESTSLVSKTRVLSIVRKRHKFGGSNRNRTYLVQNMNLVHYLNAILPK